MLHGGEIEMGKVATGTEVLVCSLTAEDATMDRYVDY